MPDFQITPKSTPLQTSTPTPTPEKSPMRQPSTHGLNNDASKDAPSATLRGRTSGQTSQHWLPDEDDADGERGQYRWAKRIIMASAVCGVAALGWYAFTTRPAGETAALVPLIPGETAFRTTPEDPGGLQVPHRDKLVYEALLEQKHATNAAVQPQAVPEEPLAQPMLARQEKRQEERQEQRQGQRAATSSAPAPAAEDSDTSPYPGVATPSPIRIDRTSQANVPAPSAAPSASSTTQATALNGLAPAAGPAEAETIAPRPAAAPAGGSAATTATAPTPDTTTRAQPAPMQVAAIAPAAVPSTTSSGVRVQLGAFRSAKEADAAWEALERNHGALVRGLTRSVERADLGAKGVFYRLQAGPLASTTDARALCNRFTQAGKACFAVK